MKNVRVLVVDDTIVFRKIISDALLEIPGVTVVGKAGNGKTALMRIKELNPDIITLDIEMPEMNGLEVLEVIAREELEPGVIMVSALTIQGGDMTIRALELGAFDFITKPEEATVQKSKDAIKQALEPIITAWQKKQILPDSSSRLVPKSTFTRQPALSEPRTVSSPRSGILPQEGAAAFTPGSLIELISFVKGLSNLKRPEIVVIGISTGGPAALASMLPSLKKSFGLPILIVQHMPPFFTQSLAKSLDAKCSIQVKEAEDGETIMPGTAYIAPGGKHMKIAPSALPELKHIKITEDPPENNCRPAVDYLFRSAAAVYPGKTLAVIMTGMGSDGTMGMRLVRRHGALTIAQDQQSSVVYGMPMEVVRAGVAELVLPLEMIATALEEAVKAER